MRAYLKIMQNDSEILLDFGSNSVARALVIAGLFRLNKSVDVLAWDEENEKVEIVYETQLHKRKGDNSE